MGVETGIQWCDSTANLWWGCTAVSGACDLCYAEKLVRNRLAPARGIEGEVWGPKADRVRVKSGWALISSMHARAMKNGGVDPALGRRRRIFVNSLSDIFDNHRSIDPYRAEAFELLERATGVDLILVTKRPNNISWLVPDSWLKSWPPHIWLLATAENQTEADRRLPILRRLKRDSGIQVIGSSIEPMIERITPISLYNLDWIIIGGESGGKAAREIDPDWARDIFAEVKAARFMKQMTNKRPIPADLMVREFPL